MASFCHPAHNNFLEFCWSAKPIFISFKFVFCFHLQLTVMRLKTDIRWQNKWQKNEKTRHRIQVKSKPREGRQEEEEKAIKSARNIVTFHLNHYYHHPFCICFLILPQNICLLLYHWDNFFGSVLADTNITHFLLCFAKKLLLSSPRHGILSHRLYI